MSLIIQISIESKSYSPGEVVRAVIRVANELKTGLNTREESATIRLQSLVAYSQGIEQLDPGWVSSSYYADKPHLNSNSKRIQRCIFRTKEAELVEEMCLFPGQQRRYSVGLQLPQHLPPSFKGTCVSYVYEMHVTTAYESRPFGLGSEGLQHASENIVMEEKNVKKIFRVRINSQQNEPLLRKSSVHSTILETSPKVSNSDVETPVMKVEFQNDINDTVPIQWDELSAGDSWTVESDCSSHRLSGNLEHLGVLGSEETLSNIGSDIRSLRSHAHSESDSEISAARNIHMRGSSFSEPTTPIIAAKAIVSSSNHKAYNLCLGDRKLVHFSLNPGLSQELHPGATFGGILDFHEGLYFSSSHDNSKVQQRCMSVNILLESEEEIEHGWLPPSLKSRDKCVIRKMYCEHMEITSDTLVTNFVFSVPPNAPGTFRTPLISHRWVLRFEFLVGNSGAVDSSGTVIKANPKSESLVWSLPVLVRSS